MKIKKRYRLKSEVWEILAISLAFIGLMLIIAGIVMII